MLDKVNTILFEQIRTFRESVKKALPEYEIEWVSSGISTKAFCTVEEVNIRFKCHKIDTSYLTKEEQKILEELNAR